MANRSREKLRSNKSKILKESTESDFDLEMWLISDFEEPQLTVDRRLYKNAK
jgi:hypothetical protein